MRRMYSHPGEHREKNLAHCSCTGFVPNSGEFVVRQERVQASQRKGLTSGEVQGTPAKSRELPGKSGRLPGTSRLLLNSTVRFETPGKSPGNVRTGSGKFWEVQGPLSDWAEFVSSKAYWHSDTDSCHAVRRDRISFHHRHWREKSPRTLSPPSQHQWCTKFLGPWEEGFNTALALRRKFQQ